MSPSQRDGPGPSEQPGASVPGIGGPGSDERSPDGQGALKLHAGISVIGAIMSAFVTVVFLWLGTLTPAIVFAVITVATLGWLCWSLLHLRRGRRHGAPPGR